MNESTGGRINFMHTPVHLNQYNYNKMEENIPKKKTKLLKKNKKKKEKSLRKSKKIRKKKKLSKRSKKTRKTRVRGGYQRNSSETTGTNVTNLPIFTQGFRQYLDNMFINDPQSFIITVMTHIRNQYVMENMYVNGDLQNFTSYLNGKLEDLLQNGDEDMIEFYILERGTFFETDGNGNEVLNYENNMLDNLQNENQPHFMRNMIELYQGLPR